MCKIEKNDVDTYLSRGYTDDANITPEKYKQGAVIL